MKDASAWMLNFPDDRDRPPTHIEFVRAIQRDALESAIEAFGHEHDFGNGLEPVCDVADCTEAIRSLLPPEPQEKP